MSDVLSFMHLFNNQHFLNIPGTWKWVMHKPKFKKLPVYWDMLQYNPPWWKGKVRIRVCVEHHENTGKVTIPLWASGEPSQCWWHLSCIYKVLKWQRKEECFSDIRNRWAKTQSMKAHRVWERGGDQGFYNMVLGAVILTCFHWIFITKLWASWGQPRDCTLSPSKFPALCTVPKTQSELRKIFPSEWVKRRVNMLDTNYTADIVLSALYTSNNVKLT